jgi:hypothetical protein
VVRASIANLITGTNYRDEVKIGATHWRFSADGRRVTYN